jgi:signal transduction histidine kinase
MAVAHLDLPAPDLAEQAREQARSNATLWLIWGIFWLLMIVISIQDQHHNDAIRWWEPILWEGSSALGATLWLVLQRGAQGRFARYLDQPLLWFAHQLKWLPLIAITFVLGVYAFRHGVYRLAGEVYEHESWRFVLVYESIKLALFAGLWLGIVFGLDSYQQWQTQRRRLLTLQKTLAEAQLSQLKAQLRPHFFFNALNTISALMHVDIERADRLLARLGDLLRLSLQSGEQGVTALSAEIRVLELYAQVMHERFAERVTLEWDIEPESLAASVPAFLLQPLLENAFKHGVERSSEPVRIVIASRRKNGELWLSVRNTQSTLAKDLREGVGMRNCREQLSVLYGEAAWLSLTQADAEVEARIVLPFREHGR